MRAGLAVLSLVLIFSACGGGSDSPTEPTSEPVLLEGAWSGSVTITNSTRATCTLSLDLERDGQDYFGDWSAQCSDGTQGSGIAVASPTFSNQVLVAGLGLQAQAVFGGCGWSSLATRNGNRLRGDWGTPQNCQSGPTLQGRMDLTKR